MGNDTLITLPEMTNFWQQTLNWQPTPQQQDQFQQLYEAVLDGNRQLNLTRITDPLEFWEKHLWDSIRGIRQFLQLPAIDNLASSEIASSQQDSAIGIAENPEPEKSLSSRTPILRSSASPLTAPHSLLPIPHQIIDIGTGAGFPGIPIAIAQPTWFITLLDSTRKKMNFLDQLLEALPLSNAKTLVDRVEQIGQSSRHRETYDIALIRAVAAASVCAEYALPLLKLGGTAILYRGQWTDAETAELQSVVQLLGGEIEAVEAFQTPLTGGDRHCLYLKKTFPTPAEFPRSVGIPTQKPLV